MSKKNLVNFEINPAIKANTALTGKESVMEKDKYNFVEGLLIANVMGIPVPLAVTTATSLAFPADQTAVLLLMNHIFNLFVVAAIVAMDTRRFCVTVSTIFATVMSMLAGAGMYRCLVEMFGAAVDYTSVASVVITLGITVLSLLSLAAVADVLKRRV